MRRHLVIVALVSASLPLQGCANAVNPSPSYLGIAPSAAADDADDYAAPAKSPTEATRHMSSNKVLGAMAFQKVTGRAVDPQRLSGNQ